MAYATRKTNKPAPPPVRRNITNPIMQGIKQGSIRIRIVAAKLARLLHK